MHQDYHERVCRCAMNRIFGFDPLVAGQLLNGLGSASSLFALSGRELFDLMGPFSKYAPSVNSAELQKTAAELHALSESGVCFITELDDEYPPLLRECEDRPVGLYVKGNADLAGTLSDFPPVAIVGTRDLSSYGKEWTKRIVEALSQARLRPAIVSGMALGCDIEAHLAALATGLPTIGVLPTCVDEIYPARHRVYERRLLELPGAALISDYPPGTKPKAINFVRRNRIIAGLSTATILVESKAVGGGLITVRMASSYGREVYALPGRIDDARSSGCNMILQKKMAEPITDLDTLVDSLGLGLKARRSRADLESELRGLYSEALGDADVENIVRVALAVKQNREITPEQICGLLGMTYSQVSRYVGQLQADGIMELDLLQRCSINVKIV